MSDIKVGRLYKRTLSNGRTWFLYTLEIQGELVKHIRIDDDMPHDIDITKIRIITNNYELVEDH